MTLKEEIQFLTNYVKRVNDPTEKIALRSILNRLKRTDRKQPANMHHNQAIVLYKQWLKHHGLPAIIDGRQGRAMKEILKKLKDASRDQTDQAAFDGFSAILQHWERVGPYLGKRKQLSDINIHLLEIIDKIKNGATKQAAREMEADTLHAAITNKYR